MLNSQPIHSLKGIGEKTGKLFEKGYNKPL